MEEEDEVMPLNRQRARGLWLGMALLMLSGPLTTFAQTAAAPAARCEADNEYQEGAILWTQTSGEARALLIRRSHWRA